MGTSGLFFFFLPPGWLLETDYFQYPFPIASSTLSPSSQRIGVRRFSYIPLSQLPTNYLTTLSHYSRCQSTDPPYLYHHRPSPSSGPEPLEINRQCPSSSVVYSQPPQTQQTWPSPSSKSSPSSTRTRSSSSPSRTARTAARPSPPWTSSTPTTRSSSLTSSPTEARSRTFSSRSRASAPFPTATLPRSTSVATPTFRVFSRATSSRTSSRRPARSRRKAALFPVLQCAIERNGMKKKKQAAS
ncbi:uncharacterized protein CTRU02_211597 [Colletotrichum truncatum]|uniref:Uncharacterized protein n=1 Tax=Colletotrichum truncatum TaxID=5467 RepID=A0ACC3YL48_COLTU